jgi:hypothetical protein
MKQKLSETCDPQPGKTICDFELPAGTRVMHIVTNGVASTLSEDEPRQDSSGHGGHGKSWGLVAHWVCHSLGRQAVAKKLASPT